MSLAWACYREPLLIQGQFQGNARLPDGLGHLLRIAAGNDSQMELLCAATGASAEQLREAAIFFVKQVFFPSDANHYRVLGVDSDASIDQIKEHHRLLMKLFHPDLDGTQGGWEDIYATKVNQSYNVLRKPESRQQYDATLKIDAQQKPIPLPVRKKRYYLSRQQVGNSGSDGMRLPLVVARNLPQFVLGGMAVLAFSVIYLFYWPGAGDVAQIQHEEPAVSKENPGRGEKMLAGTAGNPDLQPPDKPVVPEMPVQQAAMRELEIAVPEPAAAKNVMPPMNVANNPPPAPPQRVASQTAATSFPEPLAVKVVRSKGMPGPSSPRMEQAMRELPRESRATPTQHEWQVLAVAEKVSGNKDEKRPSVSSDALKVAATAPAPVATTVAPVRAVESQPVISTSAKIEAAPVAPPPVAPAISDREIELLLGRFASSYELGDLDFFVALFDDKARTSDRKGKAAIRKDYETLFSSTQTRQISFKNIHWNREGETARGEGRFALRISTQNERELKAYSGTVRFELARMENKLLIKGFFHDLDAAK